MADQGAVFRPAKKRARAATLFFWGSIVISALVATVNLWQFGLWGRMGGEIAVSPLEAEISDGASQLLAVVDVALFIGTGISFLTWFHRVRANLPALGIADARCHRGGRSAGGSFRSCRCFARFRSPPRSGAPAILPQRRSTGASAR
jgi:hypothetical protein